LEGYFQNKQINADAKLHQIQQIQGFRKSFIMALTIGISAVTPKAIVIQ